MMAALRSRIASSSAVRTGAVRRSADQLYDVVRRGDRVAALAHVVDVLLRPAAAVLALVRCRRAVADIDHDDSHRAGNRAGRPVGLDLVHAELH